MVEDCRAILTEAVFNSRWALIDGYHQLGERIVTDDNYQKWAKGNGASLSGLADNIGISERTLYRAIQFYEKYPDTDKLPEGKNISWNKVVTQYLPACLNEHADDLTLKEKYDICVEALRLISGEAMRSGYCAETARNALVRVGEI